MKKLLMMALFLAAGLVLIIPGSAAEGGSYRVVFALGNVGEKNICAMNPDGTGFAMLTGAGRSRDDMPSCSPDGSRIVFISSRNGNRDVYMMNSDGSNPMPLTQTAEDEFFPSFSNDGKKVVFDRQIADTRQLFVIHLETRKEVRLTNDGFSNADADWSPDGMQILFHSSRDELGNQLYTMTSDGRDILQLTKTGPDHCLSPDWSPDGARIAFVSMTAGTSSICVMNADGSGRKTLYSGVTADDPAWSPDGQTIAFVGSQDGYREVFTISPEGGRPQRMTFRSSFATSPSWCVMTPGQNSSAAENRPEQPDFRQVRWGMTREQIRATEKAAFERETDGNLEYLEELNGLSCTLIYIFRESRLVRAGYTVNDRFVDSNRYLREYDGLRALLAKKYGKPGLEETEWKNDTYKSMPARWGLAVSRGDLAMTSGWETEATRIRLMLRGGDSKITLSIAYFSREHAGSDDEEQDLGKL